MAVDALRDRHRLVDRAAVPTLRDDEAVFHAVPANLDREVEPQVVRRLGEVAMGIYAARSLSLAEAPETFAGLPWVGFDSALACSGPGRWIAENVPEEDIRFRANTLLGAAQAVRAGTGYGVLPCFVGGSIPNLVRMGPPLPDLSVPLWLLVHPEMARLPRIRRTSEALASRLRQAAPLLTGRG
jgi:DNA-binding transcriptional LysR family regulator